MRALVSATFGILFASAGALAQSEAGDLRFDPIAPQRGQSIRVVYRPAKSLADYASLVLRARYRTVRGERRNEPPSSAGTLTTAVATLTRRADGGFAGSFSLPDSVVYAAFAVEGRGGLAADGNDGALWDLLIHTPNGTPELEALEQRVYDFSGRNWDEAFATARRMTVVYPDRVSGFQLVHSFEGQLYGADVPDSVLARTRRNFTELERRLTAASPANPGDIATMAFLARMVSADSAGRWMARALAEAPAHPVTLMERLTASPALARRDFAAVIALEDSLWTIAGANVDLGIIGSTMRHSLGGPAQSHAVRLGDSVLIARWTERYAARGRYVRRAMALQLAALPAFRDEGSRWIRDELRMLDELRPEHRALGETVGAQRKRQAAEARPLLAGLAKALIADGKIAAGLDTLAIVDAAGWDLALFRTSAAARIAAADTVRALQAYARAIADPRSAASLGDSIAPLGRRVFGEAAWSSELARARAELPRRVLADGVRIPVRGKAKLVDTLGRARDLTDLIKGKITLVHYWSRGCGAAVAELAAADAIAARLSAKGVQVVSIVYEKLTPEIRAFAREKRLTMPLYHAEGSGLRNAIGARVFPTYWLLDASGRVRYSSDVANSQRALDELLVQFEALQSEQRATPR